MKVFLIIVAVILILLILPLRMNIEYNDELKVRIGYLFLNFTVFPSKPKKKKKPAKKKTKEKAQTAETEPTENAKENKENNSGLMKRFSGLKEKYGLDGLIELLKRIVFVVTDVMKDSAKHMIIKNLVIRALIAGEDSADTAMKYGYACSVIYPAVSILDNSCRLKKHEEEIIAGFLSEKTVVEFSMTVKITLLLLIGIVWSAFFRLVKILAKNR